MASRALGIIAVLAVGAWTGNHPAHAASAPFTICYGYECSRQQQVTLNDAQWQQIRAIFTPTASTAEQERGAVRRAIAQMEMIVGTLTGTWQDLGGNVPGSDKPKQMDCIDESTNSTTYLTLFQQDGLLTWHEVSARVRRSKWILDAHWTAVLHEKADGQLYAVDSWFLDNGQPPYIQRLEDWLDKKDFDEPNP